MRSNATLKQKTSRPARAPAANAVRASRGQALRRACVEALEERRLLSFGPAASYPVGSNPQAVDAPAHATNALPASFTHIRTNSGKLLVSHPRQRRIQR